MNKVFRIKKMLVCISLIVGASSCSVKATGDGNPTPAPVNPLEHKVAGPNIEGLWQSRCDFNLASNQYEITSMKITGQSVARKETTYADVNCVNVSEVKQWTGGFHYIAEHKENIFEVEYLIDRGNGSTQFTGENLKLEGSVLWISQYYIGEYGTPTLALTKINAAIEN